jgi:N-acetylmuramoyl-L-alanine amidase
VKIIDARLCTDEGAPVPYQESPNRGGKLVEPAALLIHYTAGRGLQQSADWLCNRKARASAQLIVGAAGGYVQLVPFDRIAWHAGESIWNGHTKASEWSIGIELDNPGKLVRTAAGWATYFGDPIPDQNVVIDERGQGWHAFSEAQILDAYLACEALIDVYPTLSMVLGHSDVAPTRKVDPGPAFPMDHFRSWLLGRGEG